MIIVTGWAEYAEKICPNTFLSVTKFIWAHPNLAQSWVTCVQMLLMEWKMSYVEETRHEQHITLHETAIWMLTRVLEIYVVH